MEFLEMLKEGEDFGSSLGQRAKKIAHFDEKLSRFMDLCGNAKGYSANQRRFLMKEAETTSDFPTLFGTVLERTLRMKYQLAKPDWRQYIKVGTQNDFRTAWDMATYGNRATLAVVKELGEYKASALKDGKFTINLQKFGRKFGLSWETIINDDLGAFSDVAADLVLSATNTEAFQATSLFVGSGGPNSTLFNTSGTHPIDGGSFANKGTLTFTGDNLATTITAMRSQKDFDGNPIIIDRVHLVTPVALEYKAMQVLSQNLLIATALGSTSLAGTQTSENVIAKYPITQHTNPWLDIIDTTHGTTSWYVFGDPADGDAVKMNFLKGHEGPEVVQKMSDKISLGGAPISPLEGDFDSDSIQWRVRDIMGGTQTDPRYAYAQAATS